MFKDRLVTDGMISAKDLDLMQVVDDPLVVAEIIFDFYEQRGFDQGGDEREELLYL